MQTTYHTIPYTAALAILHICSATGSPPNHWREDFTNKLTSCCVAVLTHTVASQGMDSDDSSWETALWKAAVNVVSQQMELWEQLCKECCRIIPGNAVL